MNKHLNVLIVDDDEIDRMTYIEYLNRSEHDYSIHSVATSLLGLEFLKNNPVDCILLDYNLPDLSGIEFLEHVNHENIYTDIPVIMFTGQGAEDIAVQALKSGAKDYIIKEYISTKKLDSVISEVIKCTSEDNIEKEKQQKIQHLAFHDDLTGLLNRHSFKEVLEGHLAVASRNKSPLCVLFLDLNKFKQVNDSLGHHAGDILLQQVADTITKSIRKSDIAARMGGDEFVVGMTDVSDFESIWLVADKLYEAISKEYLLENTKATISASIGIAVYPQDGITYDEIMRHADRAMYAAKVDSHAHYCFYNDIITQEHNQNKKQHKFLKDALINNTLHMKYQAIYNLSGQMVSMESLLRNSNDDTKSSPGSMIESAKQCELTMELSQAIINKALNDYNEIKRYSRKDLTITINVSSYELSDSTFPAILRSNIERHKIDPAHVNIEITHRSITNGNHVESIKELKALGINLTIDDFSCDLSGLEELNILMPIQSVKIDMVYIHSMLNGKFEELLVKSIMDVANNFGMDFVAKGVETKEHEVLLKKIGCEYFQGYFFQEPVDFSDLKNDLKKSKYK